MRNSRTRAIEQTTEESLIMSILEISNIFNKRGTGATSARGVTTQQWMVLLHLSQDPNIPNLHSKGPGTQEKGWLASELAHALNVSRPYMTTLVNTLLNKGLIERVEDSYDQRKKRLLLTSEGESLIMQLQPSRKQANSKLFQGITVEEREIMLKCMDKCLRNLSIPLAWGGIQGS